MRLRFVYESVGSPRITAKCMRFAKGDTMLPQIENPRIKVNFNERLKKYLVMFAKTDEIEDSEGQKNTNLAEGINALNEVQRNLTARW